MKIGKIVSVDFDQFRVGVRSDIQGNSVNLAGTVYYFGNIGGYLKVENAVGEKLVCEVVSIFDKDSAKDIKSESFTFGGDRQLLLKPIGVLDRESNFSLGVGIFPGLYSDVEIVTFEDMAHIIDTDELGRKSRERIEKGDFGRGLSQGEVHKKINLGVSRNLINYPIELSIDRLFNIHSAVLGNSGSGKSNTVAHILQEVCRKENFHAIGARVVIFDVNGEYKFALRNEERSGVEIKMLKPNLSHGDDAEEFFLPYYLMTLDEWCAFLMATDATQRPFWSSVLQEAYKFYRVLSEDDAEPFVNYFRYKICEILSSVMHQADNDTSRITAARALLGGLREIIDLDDTVAKIYRSKGLYSDVSALEDACRLDYGQNQQRLQNAVAALYGKVDDRLFYHVNSIRLPDGQYFDHRFLMLAVKLRLLEEDARGNRRLREYTSTMLARLDYFLENPDCNFMRDNPDGVADSGTYIDFLWSSSENHDNRSQIVIIDTSELPPDALETLTSVVTRVLFSQRKKAVGEDRRKSPVHLVLDEAHRYIKKDHDYIIKENIFEKVAREGRKFSTYLIVSSQRPSELSETVLSQCANFIIHRIQNERDMKYIYGVLPYFSESFSAKIKQSTPGEALVFGACVPMPLHVKVDKAEPEPDSQNCYIPQQWFIPKK